MTAPNQNSAVQKILKCNMLTFEYLIFFCMLIIKVSIFIPYFRSLQMSTCSVDFCTWNQKRYYSPIGHIKQTHMLNTNFQHQFNYIVYQYSALLITTPKQHLNHRRPVNNSCQTYHQVFINQDIIQNQVLGNSRIYRLTYDEDIAYIDLRLVTPKTLCKQTLDSLHSTH